jgi:hypothetical protein
VRLHVHLAADSVAAEVAHDGAPFALGQLHDRGTDVSEARPVADDFDAGISAAQRH